MQLFTGVRVPLNVPRNARVVSAVLRFDRNRLELDGDLDIDVVLEDVSLCLFDSIVGLCWTCGVLALFVTLVYALLVSPPASLCVFFFGSNHNKADDAAPLTLSDDDLLGRAFSAPLVWELRFVNLCAGFVRAFGCAVCAVCARVCVCAR